MHLFSYFLTFIILKRKEILLKRKKWNIIKNTDSNK